MIVLGSTSPRRKELLSLLVSDFKTIAPLFDENNLSIDTKHYALEESFNKAKSLLNQINNDDCLITSDTIVYLNNKIYGKPKDRNDAIKMLTELSNNTHEVITGYTIIYKDKVIKKEVTTKVTFNKLSNDEILNYINSINVLDKAGSYAIQDDEKFHLIKSIEGSTYNVIGFPIEDIKKDLIELGLI